MPIRPSFAGHVMADWLRTTVREGTAAVWSAGCKPAKRSSVTEWAVPGRRSGTPPRSRPKMRPPTLWEGVPLREIIWLTRPKANVRRVYYQSYHAGDLPPFQASLPLAQILENPPGQMPVILAYKMNGRVIPAPAGGPARMIVPGAYGSKQIKWIQRIVLTNNYKSNDSDAELNNDTESPIKTRARFLNVPKETAPDSPFALTGMAQAAHPASARGRPETGRSVRKGQSSPSPVFP